MDSDKLIASLDASFDAAVAREEDVAASDLAFSLLQERPLPEVLVRRGPALIQLRDGASASLSVVGRDYLGAGNPLELLVPAASAVVVPAEDGASPDYRRETLSTVLRRWARVGQKVQVETTIGAFCGVLVAVGRDHLWLQSEESWAVIGAASVEVIRAVRAG